MPTIDFPNSPQLNDVYTFNNISYIWNGSVWSNNGKSSLFSYTQNIGDGSSTTITVTHNLNIDTTIATVKEIATGRIVYPDVIYVDSNNTSFTFVNAPTLNQYNVIILGQP